MLGILRNDRRRLGPPVADYVAQLSPPERAAIADFLGAAVIGSPDTVRQGFATLLQATGADELMLVCDVYDTTLRLRALDIAAEAMTALRTQAAEVAAAP